MILNLIRPAYSVDPSHPASALAGGICGLLVDVVAHPIDTMKTRMQSMAKGTRTFRAVVGPNWRSTFVGISTNIASFPSGFAYFAVYELMKITSEKLFDSRSHVFFSHTVSGSVAEVASIIVR